MVLRSIVARNSIMVLFARVAHWHDMVRTVDMVRSENMDLTSGMTRLYRLVLS